MSQRDLARRLATLRRVLEERAPETVTQQAFDYDDAHLRRLVRLRPQDVAEPRDLCEYADDLRYTPIDVPMLRHTLPFCLRAFHDDVVGLDGDYGGFVEHFYPVLADREIFERHLTGSQAEAVAAFMRDSIVEEIDAQRGLGYAGMGARPYRWIRASTTYGVILPDQARLWNEWWQAETIGRAVAAVQVVSALMYQELENPVFAPWSRDGGGGPPALWEFGGHLYNHRWLEPNVAFLRDRLSVTSVTEAVRRAADRLAQEPEGPLAARVLAGLPACEQRLAWRCEELPTLLATSNSGHADWTF